MRENRFVGIGVFVFLLLIGGLARAETVELVTYYPTASSAGDLHVDSLTVGSGYRTNAPGNGGVFIQTQLAIGTTSPGASSILHAVGANDALSYVLFTSGQDTNGAAGTPPEIRVGIGTATPARSLEVVSTGTANGGILVSGTAPGLYLTNAGSSGGMLGVATANGNYGVGVLAGDTSLSSQGGNLRLGTTATAGGNPDVRMSILTNGNVGIGTATPSQMLDVAGNIRMSGTRSVLLTQGDNGTTHVGGVQFLTPNNGTTMVLTPTNASGAPVNSTVTLGGFGNFNSNTVGLGVSGNLGVGQLYNPAVAGPPNSAPQGNMDVNDVFVRSTGAWLSQGGIGWIKATAIYRNVQFATGGSGPTYQTITLTHHLPSSVVSGTLAVPILIQYSGTGAWGADWVFTTGGPVGNTTFRMTGDVGMRNVTFGGDFLVLFIDPTKTNYDGPG